MNNSPASSDVSALLPEVAQLMVTALNLETSPECIQPDAPLYGGDLGLDSIDILEVALARFAHDEALLLERREESAPKIDAEEAAHG